MHSWLARVELKLKNSRFFSYRKAAKRVFYPGCSLPGADPDFCLKVYLDLKDKNPELGIWFDCCAKPLRMKKAHPAAEKGEHRLLQGMLDAGVEEVIVACGNCFVQFDNFAAGRLRVHLLYDMLDTQLPAHRGSEMTIHHPCFARQRPQLQQGALRVVDALGLQLENRRQQAHPLPCCLHKDAKAKERRMTLKGKPLLTYCAHCVMSFQRDIPSRHLLQELYDSDARWYPPGKLGLFANYHRFCRLLKEAQVHG